VVLPDVSFMVWGTMLAIWTVTNRLPFLMTRDLVAIALILELPSEMLAGVETAIAAMLLTRIASDRILGLSFFIPLSLASSSQNARRDARGAWMLDTDDATDVVNAQDPAGRKKTGNAVSGETEPDQTTTKAGSHA